MVRLLAASSIRIERHTKIRAEANPYDPAWEPYFEKRLDVQMVATLKGKTMASVICGKNRTVCAQSATKRSPRSPDGIAIMFSGDQKEDQTGQKTGFCFILPAINKFIARDLHVEKPRPVTRAERKA